MIILFVFENHEKYVQPAIPAFVLNEDTIAGVFAHEGQDYSNRRSIRTYPNYRSILALSQPTMFSCVQVMDLRQVELSSKEDSRVSDVRSRRCEADQGIRIPSRTKRRGQTLRHRKLRRRRRNRRQTQRPLRDRCPRH